MSIKASLDPTNTHLSSWTVVGHQCDGSFDGVVCNDNGQVANISLQGKGLSGKLSPALSLLTGLTGLYLHYNSLTGGIPKEIANLTGLVDLYLNVNNLSGSVPVEIGNMESLQVLQLCYNQLSGSIPTQLGSMKKLSVLSLQSNQLSGALPASLGDLGMLKRLDLSFNRLFGSIPTRLADAPMLRVLDVRNNTLSGNVPIGLKRLAEGFQYGNNLGLCGVEFATLRACSSLDQLPTKNLPETADLKLNCSDTHCSKSSKTPQASIIVGVVVAIVGLSVIAFLAVSYFLNRVRKPGNTFAPSHDSIDRLKSKEVCRKNGSPLINLEYPNGWDPLAEGRRFGGVSQEIMRSFRFNLEEIESATQYFAPGNLLGKSVFSAIHKGMLRDGTVVAIKSIIKSSCKSEEAEFLKGLNVLTSLRHENLVRLRGFCCSKGRGECFLIYDFVPNGNLLRYLDMKDGDHVLDWSTRASIINGIAKGIEYLHGSKVNKPALVHQNISVKNVQLDQRFKPLLSDSGLHQLLTKDTVFSSLKASAAMGYLAPEYATTGRFTQKSDIYAFGVLVFQIISGKRKFASAARFAAESCTFIDFIDPNLHERFCELEAAKFAKVALMCTHESPDQRPSIEEVVQELCSPLC
ncbi:proline-rich receptor-like protein kinase PERK8 [Bidens hawaiensis]|uniref:proline-rich receptor-like protein kinase PERK8 n=1 Tax=Bidens hawaiensis TaxID=980011 RepID=UPI00404A693A